MFSKIKQLINFAFFELFPKRLPTPFTPLPLSYSKIIVRRCFLIQTMTFTLITLDTHNYIFPNTTPFKYYIVFQARGQQAVQAQQKNAKKKEKERKAAQNKGSSQPGVLSDAAAAKSAKCAICMQLMQQLSADKPGSLKPLAGHVSKHKGKTMIDCFPDWTPEAIELKLNGSAGESKEPGKFVLLDATFGSTTVFVCLFFFDASRLSTNH